MALKCYFDGSAKFGRRLTLAGVAGDEHVWSGLESEWNLFMRHVDVEYFHMKEVLAHKGPFSGWSKEKRNWFVNGLFTIIQSHQHASGDRLAAFTATVDLRAYDDISTDRHLPPPARMCMRGLLPKIVDWYAGFPDAILDVMDLYFDRDEGFMAHIEVDWKSAAVRTRHPAWGLIRTIEPVDMKTTAGVQVADLFAWSRTRVDTQVPNKFYGLASLICHPTNGHHYIFDRAKLSTYPRYAIM